jgi:hypothetical protein
MLHAHVNERLRQTGTAIPPDPDFIEVCKKYESFRAGCGKPKGVKKGPSCRLPLSIAEMTKNLEEFQK